MDFKPTYKLPLAAAIFATFVIIVGSLSFQQLPSASTTSAPTSSSSITPKLFSPSPTPAGGNTLTTQSTGSSSGSAGSSGTSSGSSGSSSTSLSSNQCLSGYVWTGTTCAWDTSKTGIVAAPPGEQPCAAGYTWVYGRGCLLASTGTIAGCPTSTSTTPSTDKPTTQAQPTVTRTDCPKTTTTGTGSTSTGGSSTPTKTAATPTCVMTVDIAMVRIKFYPGGWNGLNPSTAQIEGPAVGVPINFYDDTAPGRPSKTISTDSSGHAVLTASSISGYKPGDQISWEVAETDISGYYPAMQTFQNQDPTARYNPYNRVLHSDYVTDSNGHKTLAWFDQKGNVVSVSQPPTAIGQSIVVDQDNNVVNQTYGFGGSPSGYVQSLNAGAAATIPQNNPPCKISATIYAYSAAEVNGSGGGGGTTSSGGGGSSNPINPIGNPNSVGSNSGSSSNSGTSTTQTNTQTTTTTGNGTNGNGGGAKISVPTTPVTLEPCLGQQNLLEKLINFILSILTDGQATSTSTSSGQTSSANAASVCGRVATDLNGSGKVDLAHQPLLAGAKLELYDLDKSTQTPVATTQTDSNGFWRFDIDNSVSGYWIRLVPDAQYQNVVLAPGIHGTKFDDDTFLLVPSASIKDYPGFVFVEY